MDKILRGSARTAASHETGSGCQPWDKKRLSACQVGIQALFLQAQFCQYHEWPGKQDGILPRSQLKKRLLLDRNLWQYVCWGQKLTVKQHVAANRLERFWKTKGCVVIGSLAVENKSSTKRLNGSNHANHSNSNNNIDIYISYKYKYLYNHSIIWYKFIPYGPYDSYSKFKINRIIFQVPFNIHAFHTLFQIAGKFFHSWRKPANVSFCFAKETNLASH